MTQPLHPIIKSGSLNRRSFLHLSTSLAAAALWSGCANGRVARNISFPEYPFQLGVASGDPDESSVVLWTRLAPKPLEGGGMPPEAVEVQWQIAEDEGMTRGVRKGRTVARPEWAHSVHVEAGGLRPDRWYFYQFKAGNELSPVGRTRTTPARDASPSNLRFAFASCQHYESGYFTAYEHMLRDNVDLVVHLGDYIYEGAGRDGGVRKHVGPELTELEHYRNRHAQYKTDAALQAMHQAAPWLVTWDDHEVDNNYAAEISEQKKVTPEELLTRRAAAYQAYYEHMPLRKRSLPQGPNMQLFRRHHYGNLAEFFVLDTRQYRTDQPCGDGRAPQCAEALAPSQSLLGERQRDWLFKGLERSEGRWNVLAQQVIMGLVDREIGDERLFAMDQWPGYEMERRRVLQHFKQARVPNPVVLTGDIHSNWANELIPHGEGVPVAAEFVGTSISSSGNGVDQGRGHDRLLAQNPFVKFQNAQRGYVLCSLSPAQWKTDYRVVDFVTRKGAPIKTRASFILENGNSALQTA